jgi:TRAP-type C4-dicarboxylate transport system substrate-binding protein
MRKATTWLMAALCGAGLTLGGFASAEAQTMRIVHLSGESDEDYDGALVFKDYVESRTDISVEIFPGGQLCGNPSECFDALQSNTIQVFQSTIGGFGNIFPPVQALDLPYKLRNDMIAECVYDSEFLDYMQDTVLEATGEIRVMAAGNTGGWRNFFTRGGFVKSPSDLEGMDIRTINSELQQQLVELLGGNPTAIAWPELYTSFSTGVVDGSKNGITDIVNMKFYETGVQHLTLDGHAYMGSFWSVNNDFFQGLSEQEQAVVQRGFQHLEQTTRALPKRRQIEAYETFRENGGEVYVLSAEEKAAFQDAVQPLRQWYLDQYGDEGRQFLNRYESAIRMCEGKVETNTAELSN